MRPLIFSFFSLLILSSCARPNKDLATVEIGMTKTEVAGIVGEPNKKNIVNNTEIWDYPDSNRTIVFRMDTVYSIMTTAKARLDSINIWMDSTNNKAKKGFSKVGEQLEKVGNKLEEAGKNVEDKLKRDTN